MAGNFTGLRYDPQAYREEVSRSTNPMLYKLDPNYAVNCNNCFAPYGPRDGHQNAVSVGNQVDIDSILRGLGNIQSKSNQQQMPVPLNQYSLHTPPQCSNTLETQYSRYTHPAYDIKGLNVRDMRLDYPLHDPQCQIFENFQVNTRLQAKDNHRAVWPTLIDQTPALPKERLGRVKNCTLSLNCNYAPF